MIKYEKFELPNGLKVLVHEDTSTPLVAVNILYNVGARDENPERTGFAHLFEHLMFEGSKNIKNYDEPLQLAGGTNNAFTSNDITNYYLTLPAENIETAFWLESDRMNGLAFSQEKLEIQQKVVIEEYKQSYLNQPYGDIWLLLHPLCYQTHSYKWPTIGEKIEHIADANLEEVKAFFYSHYAPNNAILTLAGNISGAKAKELAEKWFAPIPKRDVKVRAIPVEPLQTKENRMVVERDVPADALLMAFKMEDRMHPNYYHMDLLSDVMSNGKSTILYEELVKKKGIFNEISAFILGSIDPGLFMIFGRLSEGFSIAEGEAAVWEVIEEIKTQGVAERDLEKVKNKLISSEKFELVSVLNVAMKLAFAELLGDSELINKEFDLYTQVTTQDLQNAAQNYLIRERVNIIEYKALLEETEA